MRWTSRLQQRQHRKCQSARYPSARLHLTWPRNTHSQWKANSLSNNLRYKTAFNWYALKLHERNVPMCTCSFAYFITDFNNFVRKEPTRSVFREYRRLDICTVLCCSSCPIFQKRFTCLRTHAGPRPDWRSASGCHGDTGAHQNTQTIKKINSLLVSWAAFQTMPTRLTAVPD